ncbi:MAG: hypothetical protein ACRC0B_02535 [Legionella sp.]
MKIIEELEGYVSNKIGIVSTLLSLFKLEARLAGLSLYPLLVNLCMLLITLLTTWFSAMLFVGYLFYIYFGTLMLSMALVFILNLILIACLLKYLTYNLKSMSFMKTRKYFSQSESASYDKLQEKTQYSDSKSGTATAYPSATGEKS